MTHTRATVTFEVVQHTFTHEQIVNIRYKGSTIGTITAKGGRRMSVWSLLTLNTLTRDGGGPGNGIDINFINDDDDDDDDDEPQSH